MVDTKTMLLCKIDGLEKELDEKCGRMRELISQDKKDSDEFFQLRRDIYALDLMLCTLYHEVYLLER